MAASNTQLRNWFKNGVTEGYERMVVFCDTFDRAEGDCCYPSYHNETGDELRALVTKSADRLMEVYDLTADLEVQMGQRRVFNYDSPPPVYVGKHRATEAVNESFNR